MIERKKNLLVVVQESLVHHAAIELYAEAFDGEGAIERLEGFASIFGPDFYGLSSQSRKNYSGEVCLGEVPDHYEFAGSKLTPFFAGAELSWRLLA